MVCYHSNKKVTSALKKHHLFLSSSYSASIFHSKYTSPSFSRSSTEVVACTITYVCAPTLTHLTNLILDSILANASWVEIISNQMKFSWLSACFIKVSPLNPSNYLKNKTQYCTNKTFWEPRGWWKLSAISNLWLFLKSVSTRDKFCIYCFLTEMEMNRYLIESA